MAVPARHIGRILAQQVLRAADHVLEDVVERVADVHVAIGIGRAVVEDELLAAPARVAQLLVQPSASQRAAMPGSFWGRPAFIGKSVFGRKTVSLSRAGFSHDARVLRGLRRKDKARNPAAHVRKMVRAKRILKSLRPLRLCVIKFCSRRGAEDAEAIGLRLRRRLGL